MNADEIKKEKARQLRYKKAVLAGFCYEDILTQLEEISEVCVDVRFYCDDDDGKSLMSSRVLDDEEEYEMQIMFSDLSGECDRLLNVLREQYIPERFDDFTCAVSQGTNYRVLGFDVYEEDYFYMTGDYEEDLARNECKQRLMRLTKEELIRTGCQCFGIITSFLNIQTKYDSLKAAFDILTDENTAYLQVIKDIEAAYIEADRAGWYSFSDKVKRFEELVDVLPDKAWVE